MNANHSNSSEIDANLLNRKREAMEVNLHGVTLIIIAAGNIIIDRGGHNESYAYNLDANCWRQLEKIVLSERGGVFTTFH